MIYDIIFLNQKLPVFKKIPTEFFFIVSTLYKKNDIYLLYAFQLCISNYNKVKELKKKNLIC